jgi:hypothetical protein
VSSVWPIVLFGLGGILAGGAVSVRKQGAGAVPVVALGALAALAVVGGIFWLVGE